MSGIGGVHAGIAQRVFRAVGPRGAPARVVHDSVSAAVYAGCGSRAKRWGAGRRRWWAGGSGDRSPPTPRARSRWPRSTA